MSKDKRVKGCPNETCAMHIDKKKFPVDDDFCSKCGAKLIYVCSKCFAEIEDLGPEHRKCKLCEAEAAAKKAKRKESLKEAGGKVGAVVMPIGGAAIAGMKKEGVKQAAAAGAKAVKEVVKIVPKVIK